MKSLIAFLFIFLAVNVHAKQINMAVITSEFDQNTRNYYLEIDDKNEIHSMRYVTSLPNGGILEDDTITPEQVMESGVVLFEHRGYNAVILEVENFSVKTGGTIKVNYLYSGVTGARNVKILKLKVVNNEFVLYDQDKRVNRMFFEVNRNRVLGIIGVKAIHTSFGQK